jgi:hypothetical protein
MHEHGGRAGPARPPRRRWRWRRSQGWPYLAGLVGAVLALTLGVAACGGGDNSDGVASLSGANKATTTTTAPLSKQDAKQAALDFARCMRQHGIDMPDPKFNGNQVTQDFSSGPGSKVGPDDPKFKAAQQACQQYQPSGGQLTKPNPQQQQQMLQFARCMRQHGINVPDPNPNGGGIVVKGGPGTANPDDPKFKAAQQACNKYLPNAGKSGTLQSSGGGK